MRFIFYKNIFYGLGNICYFFFKKDDNIIKDYRLFIVMKYNLFGDITIF